MDDAAVQVDREGKIIVTLGSNELNLNYDDYALNIDSSDSDIISALKPVFEEEGIALDEINQAYVVKRQVDSGNTYIFPKSTAGSTFKN